MSNLEKYFEEVAHHIVDIATAPTPTDILISPFSRVFCKESVPGENLEKVHEFDFWNEVEGFIKDNTEHGVDFVDLHGNHTNVDVVAEDIYLLDTNECILYKVS